MALAFSSFVSIALNSVRISRSSFCHTSSFGRAYCPLRSSIRSLGNATSFSSIDCLRACYHTSPDDTIFALSTGSLATVSGVAVVRLSGKHAHWAANQLLRPPDSLPPTRRAGYRVLVDPLSGSVLDQAIVICFLNPASFTGEDVAELHLHGSRAVVRAVLQSLSRLSDEYKRIRYATAGEFTRRAFENGRLDLTAVEGLADLLAADTDRQRIQALNALGGSTHRLVAEWRTTAVQCLAHAEAALDFSDDVDGSTFDAVIPKVRSLAARIARRVERDGQSGEIVRTGVRIAIAGRPNVGKSTLINALARRPVAIVADNPGTTRDVLSVSLELKGVPVTICDTAGIRDVPGDQVEAEGIRRARDAVADAHIAVVMHDATDLDNQFEMSPCDTHVIHVANKTDLLDKLDEMHVPQNMHQLSLVKDASDGWDGGLDSLIDKLSNVIEQFVGGGEGSGCGQHEMALITRMRHREHLQSAVTAMERFLKMRDTESGAYAPMDLATEELRLACREIGSVIGEVHVEEVLDVVFSEFCIGK